MPSGCRAQAKATGASGTGGKAGQGKGGGKQQGGGKAADSAGGGKATPPRQQQRRQGKGRSQGDGQATDRSAGSMLASIQALATAVPLLRALGLTGKGQGRSGGQDSVGKQPKARKSAPSPSGEVVVRSRQSKRCRDQHPEQPVLLAGTKKQATLVRPDTGDVANIVSVCAGCHWPYWSTRWSQCVNCQVRRDEVTRPGPKVWDPRKVQTQYCGAVGDGKSTAKAKTKTAPPPTAAAASSAEVKTATGRTAMFALDLESVPGSDMEWDCDGEEEVDDAASIEADDAVIPSGLTPYWVKFLLRQGMAAAQAYREQLGFVYEVDIDKQAQLDLARKKMAHIVASGGSEFMGEELAAYADTIKRLEQEISLEPGEPEAEDLTAHAKYAQLLERCSKAAAKAKEDAFIQHAAISEKIAALEEEQLALRKQSVAQMSADMKLHGLLAAKVEATASHSFQKVLAASDFTAAVDNQMDTMFDATWLAQNGMAQLPKATLQAIIMKTKGFWVNAASEAVQSQLDESARGQAAANMFNQVPATCKDGGAGGGRGRPSIRDITADAC